MDKQLGSRLDAGIRDAVLKLRAAGIVALRTEGVVVVNGFPWP
jgi:hypothetical protein